MYDEKTHAHVMLTLFVAMMIVPLLPYAIVAFVLFLIWLAG